MFEQELHALEACRRLRTIESFERRGGGPFVWIEGRRYTDFCSNDYLGLSRDPKLILRTRDSIEIYGMGSGGSRLLGGANLLFDHLEVHIASFLGKERAIVFGSGYLANLGVITALASIKGSAVLLDRYSHASIIDGTLLSGAGFHRFRHNDLNHLEAYLKKFDRTGRHVVVVVESVYSMDGDVAPIHELIELKARYGFTLVVDEAHAIGVFGRDGRGLVTGDEALHVDCIIGTFGKALGGYGAFCATSGEIASLLVNKARSFIFSTALPIPVVVWNLQALRFSRRLHRRRAAIRELSTGFRRFLKDTLGLTSSSQSQIVPVLIGDAEKTVEVAQALKERGVYLRAIRPPTVPPGTSRLRVSISWLHRRGAMEDLMGALRDVLSQDRYATCHF